MIGYDPVTLEKGQCIALSRGATAIYLALKCSVKLAGAGVIVPANICYAAVYPIQYAGMKPVFCDVDPLSGNVTFDSFKAVCGKNIKAAVLAHMYGNPIQDLPDIAAYCRINGILLIEDCASAMGCEARHYRPGTLGDYVIYSTGYSKTLDLGYGGFLFSKEHDLSSAEKLEKTLSVRTQENEDDMTFFSKLYRLMRNEGTGTGIEKMIYNGLADCCRDSFLQRINDEEKHRLFTALESLPDVIKKRRAAFCLYRDKLTGVDVEHYPFHDGAVPWRYNILLEDALRKKLISECLVNSLPVSDWYPVVTDFFAVNGDFPGAKRHERMILNFPLLIGEEVIDKICHVIRKTLA